MNDNYLSDVKKVYFIGIGGVSMSGLAMVLKNRGHCVSGSDSKGSDITHTLSQSGIDVYIGQCAENIGGDIDLAVYSAAISADNPEMLEIKRRGIELIPRSKLLGIIMSQFDYSVAVAGTHGKTTTTAMVSQILINASCDPTISIGGIFPLIDSNIRIGGSGYFVSEACEYTNSFLELSPNVAIVLNVELDHIDYFKNMDEVRQSFKGFVSNIKDGGAAVVYSGIDKYEEIAGGKRLITFGFDAGDDWRAVNIKQDGDFTSFELYYKSERIGEARMPLHGTHNVVNALAACAAAYFLGVPKETVFSSIEKFVGAKRRFEFRGEINNILVYDDYAHHPSEIKATLAAARGRFGERRLRCVFQPHTYSRARAFLSEFSESFADADEVILSDIYAAREKDPGDINSEMLLEKIIEQGKEARYFKGFDEIADYIEESSKEGDVVMTMGAGDIYVVGEKLLGI